MTVSITTTYRRGGTSGWYLHWRRPCRSEFIQRNHDVSQDTKGVYHLVRTVSRFCLKPVTSGSFKLHIFGRFFHCQTKYPYNPFVLGSFRSHCGKILLEVEIWSFRVKNCPRWVPRFYECRFFRRTIRDVPVWGCRSLLGLRGFGYSYIQKIHY